MTTNEMITLVDRFLDSKNLANPSIRKNAIRKVASFFEETGSFIQGKQLALPSDKTIVKEAYGRFKGSDLSGAESSAINHMYEVAGKAVGLSSNKPIPEPKPASVVKPTVDVPLRKDAPERMLIEGKFVAASEVTESMVPDVPGLYCVKLRKNVALPAKFGKVAENGIIYIGQASKSLRKRFWEQELNHKSAATFFRSIGAMLGYLPPKGSLAGKPAISQMHKFSSSPN